MSNTAPAGNTKSMYHVSAAHLSDCLFELEEAIRDAIDHPPHVLKDGFCNDEACHAALDLKESMQQQVTKLKKVLAARVREKDESNVCTASGCYGVMHGSDHCPRCYHEWGQ